MIASVVLVAPPTLGNEGGKGRERPLPLHSLKDQMKIYHQSRVVFAELRTFVGSAAIGAEHYYVTVSCEESKYQAGEIEAKARIRRKIGADEATALNEKDGYDTYKAGTSTDRFPSAEAALKAAIRFYRKTFPEALALVEGSTLGEFPHWPARVIHAEKRVLAELNRIHQEYIAAEDAEDEETQKQLSLRWRHVWADYTEKHNIAEGKGS